MHNFTFYAPTKVVFGRGTEAQAGALAKSYGAHKVLLHYGGKSALKSGLVDRVKASLTAAGLDFVELGGVVPNPLLSKVREGIALCLREGVDFLLPVGGGSVIDSAKAIACGIAEPDKDVWDLYQKKRIAKKCAPLGVVLTIAATGSEMSNSSVITNDQGEKRSYNDNIIRAKFAIMNPELTMTLPDYQTESGCSDIMLHTMERWFVNDGTSELTDGIATALMRTVMKHAVILHTDPTNYDSRAEVMWAGSLSHNDLTGCGGKTRGDWACHKLEHELSSMFGVTHGAGLAAIWGTWARYVHAECEHRFVKFATDVMGVAPAATDAETSLRGIEAMENFFRSIGMPTNLRELGVRPTEEQILELAAGCARGCGGKVGSAKVLTEEDMAQIYRLAK